MTRPITSTERALLRAGVLQWLGPVRVTDAVRRYVGSDDPSDISADVERLLGLLDAGDEPTDEDFRRALLMTEVAFVSDHHGAGVEWEAVTEFSDVETIGILRGLQLRDPSA